MELLQFFLSLSERIYEPSVESTLTLNQSVTRSINQSITSTLSLSQSATKQYDPHNESITSILSLSHSVSTDNVINISITSSLSFSQSEQDDFINVESISHTLSLSYSVDSDGVFNRSITNSLSFNSKAGRWYTPVQSLVFDDDLDNPVDHTRELTSTLLLTQTLTYDAIFNRSLIDYLIFGLRKKILPIDGLEHTIPEVQYSIVPAKCRVILSVPSLSIVLPCPIFGDSINNQGKLSSKRTMTGGLYTYVKESELNRIKYEFLMSTNKARELRSFIQNYLSDRITMKNWKGETWLTYITNNPVENITKSLAKPTDEQIDVTLEFEGVLITPA